MGVGTMAKLSVRRWLRAAVLGCAGLGATLAQAQVPEQPATPEPPCLVSSRPKLARPEYPAWISPRTEAVVRVELTFVGPDAGPSVKLVSNTGVEAFAQAVRDFVAYYRMPCLKPDETLQGAQTYQFSMGRHPPKLLQAQSPEAGIDSLPLGCSASIRNAALPDYNDYPSAALKTVARMIFTARDRPPTVEWLFNAGPPSWTAAVRAVTDAYRLPCMPAADGRIVVDQFFHYNPWPLKPQEKRTGVNVEQLVSLLKNAKQGAGRFDFNTMACPFNLSFELYRPFAQNAVIEMGSSNANRAPFLAWLRGVSFDVSDGKLRGVLGEAVTVSVPCGVLDLT